MKRLEGKTAFVTGGGAGLGKAIVLAFAREGAVVGVADIDEAAAKATAAEAGNGSVGYACDVARRDEVRRVVDGFAAQAGGLDILVNNAVAFHYAPLVDMPPDKIDRMLDVGIKGTFWALQAATPHLVARGGGASVINLSSVAVSFAIKNAAVYSSIKGAIDTLTRQQACELGPQGVRVNALAHPDSPACDRRGRRGGGRLPGLRPGPEHRRRHPQDRRRRHRLRALRPAPWRASVAFPRPATYRG
jgi:NAD(P)-dependent dehydrogenase (short-subunit alcohol dehydrogenase family)